MLSSVSRRRACREDTLIGVLVTFRQVMEIPRRLLKYFIGLSFIYVDRALINIRLLRSNRIHASVTMKQPRLRIPGRGQQVFITRCVKLFIIHYVSIFDVTIDCNKFIGGKEMRGFLQI